MKILFTRFPLESIPGGGAETQIINLASGLSERGHAVAYVGSCPALLESFDQAHMITAELDIGSPPVTKMSVLTFPWRKKAMRKKLEAMLSEFGRLDVIVMLSLTEKLLLTDIAAARGIKVVWIEHDPVGKWLTRNPWLKKLREQSKYATTVTVSELSRIQYLEMDWNPKKIVAIPNGIADSWFKKKPAAKRVKDPTVHLGCVARFAKEKGVDVLVRAVAEVPHTTLDLVGEGPERPALEKLIRRLHMEHRVRFLGRVDDIAHVYRVSDGVVLPSRSIDPFGMAIAEAMAMGVPCVVTDAVGIASCLKEDRDVLVVDRDNFREMAKAIKRLHDAKIRTLLSQNGARAARQQFSVSTMVDRYETMFTERPHGAVSSHRSAPPRASARRRKKS